MLFCFRRSEWCAVAYSMYQHADIDRNTDIIDAYSYNKVVILTWACPYSVSKWNYLIILIDQQTLVYLVHLGSILY